MARPLVRLLSILVIAGACERGRAEQLPRGLPTHHGLVVDSVVPRGEALRTFRSGLARPAGLAGGAGSREELVQAFVAALTAADTVALVRMAVTRAEFAYLYYETSPQSLPPYDLSPGLMWFTVDGKSRQDLAAAVSLFGGKPIRYLSHACGEPRTEGLNRVHGFCTVRYVTTEGSTEEARLFGLILERDGRYKFLSYGNKL